MGGIAAHSPSPPLALALSRGGWGDTTPGEGVHIANRYVGLQRSIIFTLRCRILTKADVILHR